MRFAHPWKDILFYKDDKSMAEENYVVNENGVTEEEMAPEIFPTTNQEGAQFHLLMIIFLVPQMDEKQIFKHSSKFR